MVYRTRGALAALLCLLAALLGACGPGASSSAAPLTAADVVRAWRADGLTASEPALAPASAEGAYIRRAPTAGCTIWVVLRPADTPGAGAWGYVADCRTPAARDRLWGFLSHPADPSFASEDSVQHRNLLLTLVWFATRPGDVDRRKAAFRGLR